MKKIKTNKKGGIYFDKHNVTSFGYRDENANESLWCDLILGNADTRANRPPVKTKVKKSNTHAKPFVPSTREPKMHKNSNSYSVRIVLYGAARKPYIINLGEDKKTAQEYFSKILTRRRQLYKEVKAKRGTVDRLFLSYLKEGQTETIEKLKSKYGVKYFELSKYQKPVNLIKGEKGRLYSAISFFGTGKSISFSFGLVGKAAQEMHTKLIERRDIMYKELKVIHGTDDPLFAKFVRTGCEKVLNQLKKKYPK